MTAEWHFVELLSVEVLDRCPCSCEVDYDYLSVCLTWVARCENGCWVSRRAHRIKVRWRRGYFKVHRPFIISIHARGCDYTSTRCKRRPLLCLLDMVKNKNVEIKLTWYLWIHNSLNAVNTVCNKRFAIKKLKISNSHRDIDTDICLYIFFCLENACKSWSAAFLLQ